MGGRRLRQRRPAPVLDDSDVLATEMVGEFLAHTLAVLLNGYRGHPALQFARLAA
jgi:hypothetical protein